MASARFEELAWSPTPLGDISLRRRVDPLLKEEVYEVKLGDEFLMSSLFPTAEIELARLGLARLPADDLDVVVGGLGLGYTAQAVLEDPRVRSLIVVEALAEVIDWHERELLPQTSGLVADPRTRLVHGDFFRMAGSKAGFDPAQEGRQFAAVLVDIDHTPRHVLHQSHSGFYTVEGFSRLKHHVQPGGVFALWSDDPPDESLLKVLGTVFPSAEATVVGFPNPFTGLDSANTVYLAVRYPTVEATSPGT